MQPTVEARKGLAEDSRDFPGIELPQPIRETVEVPTDLN